MISATLKVRAIPEATFQAILEMIQEEAKDVSVDVWSSNEPPGYVARRSRINQRQSVARRRR